MNKKSRAGRAIVPVIVGYDVGAYSFARIFHEAGGYKSVVLTTAPRGPINDSRILDVRLFERGTFDDDERFLAALADLECEFVGCTLILLVNADEHVEFVARNREHFGANWFLPYSPLGAVQRANSKGAMAELLTYMGLNAPKRVVVDLSAQQWPELDEVCFPAVVKPESGADLAQNWGRGLRKVELWKTRSEALKACEILRTNGVEVRVIIQEFIPGDDTTQWLVNGYVNRQGQVTACGSGRLILGLHQPEYIGNAGIVLTEHHPKLIEQATRIVTAVGIRGYFSMDVKIDPRNGKTYWLDLNPRIGRGHYYMKLAGVDLAAALLADLSNDLTAEEEPREGRSGNGARSGEGAAYSVPARSKAYQTNSELGLFCLVPSCLANSCYVTDPQLLKRVRQVKRQRRAVNPLLYRADRSLGRYVYVLGNSINHYRRMRAYYRQPDPYRL